MSFNAEEKHLVEKLFPKEINAENIKDSLDKDIYDFLFKHNYIRTIIDNNIWYEVNSKRPNSRIRITKFLSGDENLYDIFKTFLNNIQSELLLFFDCHFLVTCPARDTDESDIIDEDDNLRVFKFQRGSKASAINETIKISNKADKEKFLSFFKNTNHTDLLMKAFQTHSDLYHYHTSGLRPHTLLSIVLHVQKMK